MRKKRVAIVGSRGFEGYVRDFETDELVPAYDIIVELVEKYYKTDRIMFLHGGGKGCDVLVDKYADKHGIPVKCFPPCWDRDKNAIVARNRRMARFADEALAFWDFRSKGVEDMINQMRSRGKKIRLVGGWKSWN